MGDPGAQKWRPGGFSPATTWLESIIGERIYINVSLVDHPTHVKEYFFLKKCLQSDIGKVKNVDNFEKVHIPTTTITIAGSIPRLIWKSMYRIPPVHFLRLHLCRISFSGHISIFLYQSRQFFLIASTFLYLFYFSSKTANYKVHLFCVYLLLRYISGHMFFTHAI